MKTEIENLPIEPKIKPKADLRLNSLNFKGIKLTGGMLKDQYDSTFKFYKNIKNEKLLSGFKKRAGFEFKDDSLGGWYGIDFFNNFGQLLSGFSRFYIIEKDKEILEKILFLMYEWKKTIDKNNFFFYSDHPNAPHYFFDKMVGGLVDIFQFTGNKDSIDLLSIITDWAEKNLDRGNIYAHCEAHGSTEWYTLPENLFRAFIFTADEKYLNLARAFFYKKYYEFYINNDFKGLMEYVKTSKFNRYHAYSHVNTLGGAAMHYYLSGDNSYLELLKNAFNILRETQLFNTGGYGASETFLLPQQRTESIYTEDFHNEVFCNSWAAMKLVRYLTEFTGDSFYGNWSENVIYNGISAALPVREDGNVIYYANYNYFGAVKETCNPWSCCTGSCPLDLTEYHNQIYYCSENEIFINLFTPSVLSCTVGKQKISLEQITDYPAGEKATLKISLNEPTDFKIGIRVPSWSSDLGITINNNKTQYNNNNGKAEIRRIWDNNDLIEILLPMKINFSSINKVSKFPGTFSYGPTILASLVSNAEISSEKDIEVLKRSLRNMSTNNLRFQGNYNNTKYDFVPFYDVEEKQKYWIYWDVKDNQNRIYYNDLKYGPDFTYWIEEKIGHPVWVNYKDDELLIKNCGNKALVSLKDGAFFEADFTGEGLIWIGSYKADGGKADIYIDDIYIETVDQYGNTNGIPWIWEIKELKNIKHKIRVITRKDKNNYSSGYSINVKHLKIF